MSVVARSPMWGIFPYSDMSVLELQAPSKPRLSVAQLEAIARQFRVLGESSRLRLLACLMEGPATVGELVTATGFKQGNVSKQLAALHEAGFLFRQRDGNFVRYGIADPVVFELCELMCGSVGREARQRAEALAG